MKSKRTRGHHASKRTTGGSDRALSAHLKLALLSATQPGGLISHIRKDATFPEIRATAEYVQTRRSIADRFKAPDFPESPEFIWEGRAPDVLLLSEAPVEREIWWSGAWLAPEGRTVRRFVELDGQYDRAMLLGDIDGARTTLETIRSELGWSMWLVKQWVRFLQTSEGLDAQKRFRDELSEGGASGFAEFVAYHASVLNEPSVSAAQFASLYRSALPSDPANEQFSCFLRHLFIPEALDERSIAAVLRRAARGTIVDLYDSSLVVARELSSGSIPHLVPRFVEAFSALSATTRDPRLTAALWAMGASCAPPLPAPRRAFEAFERLLEGDPVSSFRDALEVLEADPGQADALIIAGIAQSKMQSQEPYAPEPLRRIIEDIAAVARGGAAATRNAQSLLRSAYLALGRPWAQAVRGFVSQEMGTGPFGNRGDINRAVASLPWLHPLRTPHIPGRRVEYAAMLASAGADSLSREYVQAYLDLGANGELIEGRTAMDPVIALELDADRLFGAGRFSEVEPRALRLADPDSPARARGLRLLVHTLLALGRTGEAARRVVREVVADSHYAFVMPLAEIAAALRPDVAKTMRAELALPLFWDVYASLADTSQQVRRRMACEDFLLAHGLQRPSEISSLANHFDRRELIHFLQHVCVESVLETHEAYDDSGEVTDERIKVCGVLATLDPEHANLYQAEAADLMRQQRLLRRRQKVEQSLIHVDIAGVRRAVEVTLRDSFRRYSEFVKSGFGADASAEVKEVQAAVLRAIQGDYEQIVQISLPRNERRDLLRSMVEQVRDAYAIGPGYGLNTFLSTRIRHITLEGQLREPLDHAHLTAELDSTTKIYIPDEYWLDRVGGEDPEVRARISAALGEFAHSFDNLVRDIRTNWLQIRRTPEDVGMFEFVISDGVLAFFESMSEESSTYDEFVTYTMLQLDSFLDGSLERIRVRLQTEGGLRLATMFDDLLSRVDQLRDVAQTHELAAAITAAGTEMQTALRRIAGWFRRGDSTAQEPFEIDEAVAIGQELARGRRSVSAQVVSESGSSFRISGLLFSDYVDVFFTAFANVATRSRTEDPSAEVRVDYKSNGLFVRIENVTGPGARTPESEASLARIRDEIASGRTTPAVSGEGGTGLLKIANSLTNITSRWTLSFGFDSEDRFFVEFFTPLPPSVRV